MKIVGGGGGASFFQKQLKGAKVFCSNKQEDGVNLKYVKSGGLFITV